MDNPSYWVVFFCVILILALKVVYFAMRLEIFLLFDCESNAICFSGKWSSPINLEPYYVKEMGFNRAQLSKNVRK